MDYLIKRLEKKIEEQNKYIERLANTVENQAKEVDVLYDIVNGIIQDQLEKEMF